jgi:rRNA maturation endonuclease Nob1
MSEFEYKVECMECGYIYLDKDYKYNCSSCGSGWKRKLKEEENIINGH